MFTFAQQRGTPVLDLLDVGQHLHGLLLGELIDVIGVLDLVEQRYDLLGGESHAQTDCRRRPQLGEGVQHDEVGEAVEVEAEGACVVEVAVGLIDDHNALKLREHTLDGLAVEGIARGVIGRAEPDNLGVVITGCQQAVCIEREVFIEFYGTVLDIVDVGTDAIHAVGG